MPKRIHLKTKPEIRNILRKLYNQLKAYPHIPYHERYIFDEIIRGQIQVLKMVLGYKEEPNHFFCIDCQKVHKNLRCPYCENSEEIKPTA